MCIKFVGDQGVLPKIINFTGNAAVLAVGGIGLGVLSYVALKALGFSKIAGTVAAIPLTIGVIGTVGSLVAGFACVALFIVAVKAYYR